MEETEGSLHDAIMIVRRTIKNDSVVAGGGAIEMELSKYLQDYSRTVPGKQQLLIGAYAKALEIIPHQLCDNAGFDATNILNKLRARHAQVGPFSPQGSGFGQVGWVLNVSCAYSSCSRVAQEIGCNSTQPVYLTTCLL